MLAQTCLVSCPLLLQAQSSAIALYANGTVGKTTLIEFICLQLLSSTEDYAVANETPMDQEQLEGMQMWGCKLAAGLKL